MRAVSRMVSGLATRQVARAIGGAAAGPVGMAMGLALPYLARALGPAGMVGLALGGWAVKRVIERRGRPGAGELGAKGPGAKPSGAGDSGAGESGKRRG